MTSHFHKTLDPIGSNLFSHAEPGYGTFYEVPPPPPEEIAHTLATAFRPWLPTGK